jgi:hypothetical protein
VGAQGERWRARDTHLDEAMPILQVADVCVQAFSRPLSALSLPSLSLSQRLKVPIYIRIIAVCSSALLGQWPYGATAQTAWESPEFLQATEALGAAIVKLPGT